MKREESIYVERNACPLYTAIGVISGRWKPMIIQRLAEGPQGFGALQRSMPRMTRKVLREQLRQLEADGLVARRALIPSRLGVRYRLTPYAASLNPIFNVLLKWGIGHLARPAAAEGTRVYRPSSATAISTAPARTRTIRHERRPASAP